MWTTFVLILCQHFIFSSAAPIDLSTTPIDPVRQGTPPAGSATSAAAFLSENSSVFNSTPLLAANLQNTTAANTSKADAQTSSSLAPTSQSVFTNTSHLTSTVLPTTPLTHTSQHSPPLDGTAAPNITSNSSVTVPSYSPNMTNSSAQSDNATSTTHSLLTNSTAQPTSLHPFTNSSSTSRKSTSLPNGTVKVPTVSFPTPAASTTVLPSSSRTSASTSLSTNPTEKENKIAAPSNADGCWFGGSNSQSVKSTEDVGSPDPERMKTIGRKQGTALTVVVSLILVAVALLGLVMYLKKRRVFYSRLQEDNPTGSWSNYNNPVFEDS